RLAIALGRDAILPNCPVCLFKFLHDQDWRIHHAAVTAIGLISDGCSKALLVEMVKFGQSIVNLMQDSHPRLLPTLIEVLDDFDYPRLQTRVASVIRLFSRNCRADDLKLYLRKIVSKLVRFLQRGLAMMKEAALETLASVAISSQVTAVLISLQETQTEIEDPMRKFSLLAYGRLCKCLGEDFLPYLSLAMPIVLKSAQLSVSNSSDTDDSDDESLFVCALKSTYSQIPGSRLRCRVGLDVAKALSYLHHDCRSCILHLDVKPENILLNENHRAILADFGLSKLMGKVESRVVTTIKGTRGYLAPEWLLENGISEKSDVYSYGMVLLEMIGGRRNITLAENGKSINSKSKFSYFPKIVSEKLEQGKIMEVLDERLVHEAATGGVAVEMQVKRLACVALSCIQERPSLRPTMARVVEMLEGRGPVEAPRQTTMLILDLLDEGVDHHPGIPRVAATMARSSDTNSLRFYTMSILSGR
uniref:Avr9/Cf-9 rapidly elicited protein 11 n=2 Tax=Solanum tuberosum TaxID=4113 RepID=M1B639_SOLTU